MFRLSNLWQNRIIAVFGIIISAYISTNAKGIGILTNAEWGMKKEAVIKSFSTNKRFSELKPMDHPEYKNRIMDHISMLDMSSRNKLIVIKTKTNPEIEYLFLDDYLFCIVEDWKEIKHTDEQRIDRRLFTRYGKPHIQRDSNLTIQSYNDNTTYVVYQKLYKKDGTMKCKIYYYTKKIFRKLMGF